MVACQFLLHQSKVPPVSAKDQRTGDISQLMNVLEFHNVVIFVRESQKPTQKGLHTYTNILLEPQNRVIFWGGSNIL